MAQTSPLERAPWLQGCIDALPLLGGYIPVAISFGLISVQAGFSALEATLISLFIYAGASQFLFVAMIASGAPLWLVCVMTLLINARHIVYGPNIAPWLSKDIRWPLLMHGLTDQIFALAHTRLPELAEPQRMAWFTAAMLVAWASWVGGTALGAQVGAELTEQWPLLSEVLPFALPALFLVLIAPRFNSGLWSLTLLSSVAIAISLKLLGFDNAAIPVAALASVALHYLLQASIAEGAEGHE